MLALVALSAAFLSPAVSMAYKVVCYNSYDILVCNDGTRVGCATPDSNGLYYQRDCTDADAEKGCGSHGGFRTIDPGEGESQEAVFHADYAGALPLAGFDGEGEINSTMAATLEATCSNGRSFSCDDERQACPRSHAEIVARCKGSGGLKSAAVFTAFTPLRNQ